MIRLVFSQNTTLQQQLGLDDGIGEEKEHAASNTIQVVFQHVLKDDKPPERLVSLVIDTLAACLELGLWTQLEPMINHAISLSLISAMLLYRQIKGEEIERMRIKSEIAPVRDEHASFGLNE
jgi:hypothetical protein